MSILTALMCGNGSCPCRSSADRGRGLTHCPVDGHHPDTRPSLNVTPADDKILVTCHGGCPQEAVIAVLQERGLWNGTQAPNIMRRLVAEYTYTDRDGNPLFVVERYDPKDFRQRKADGTRSLDGVSRVLYRLPEVLAAVARKETIFIVEGEKDADNLSALGLTATCSPGGAGKWQEAFVECLIGASVVVGADRDEAGRAHARAVAQSCEVGCRSVRIIEFPVGKDASDWIASGGSKLALEVLIDDTPEWGSSEKVIWTPRESAKEYREVIEKRLTGDPEHVGWRTGFQSIDKNLRYRAGEVWMVVAATSVGKSAFMQSLQRRATVPSAYLSLEMSRTQMLDRLISAEANVDAWNLSVGNLTTEERRRVHEAVDRFETTDMEMSDRSMGTRAIETVLRIRRVRTGIRLVFLDYIGLVNDRDGESRYVQMSNISHNLKRIAMSVGVCMVVGSQVNRKGDRKSGEPPFLDEIRDSGVVGEDADVILALGREGSDAKLAVRKARNALAGYPIPLTFDALHAQFIEPSEASLKKAETRYGTPREAEEIPF